MPYVDGFVIPLPEKNLAKYKQMARLAGKIWREYGALDYVECIADDVPYGKRTSFPRAVKIQDGETVVFAYVVYKSRADRNRIMKKVMADPRLEKYAQAMPFDGKRMIFGGFRQIVKA